MLATGNKGKVKEMADVLADFGFEVIAQTDLGIESPEETGLTFVENAILKARYASEKSGLRLLQMIRSCGGCVKWCARIVFCTLCGCRW